jgi:excisionase family DNA binding protein
MSTLNAKPLTVKEAAEYLNISVSHLYKLTSEGKIKHYKPTGGRLYFFQGDLNDFIKSDKVLSDDEISREAAKRTAVGLQ